MGGQGAAPLAADDGTPYYPCYTAFRVSETEAAGCFQRLRTNYFLPAIEALVVAVGDHLDGKVAETVVRLVPCTTGVVAILTASRGASAAWWKAHEEKFRNF